MPQSNFWIDLIASLNKKRSKEQIKNDVQNLGDIKFPLIGTLFKAKTKAQIAKDLSSLNASTELKVKVDSRKVANNVQLATQQAQKQVKPMRVNFEVKKEKLINDIKVLAKTNSAMFKDVDITSKYNALLDSAKFANNSKELRNVRLQLSALRSELKATNLAGLSLTDTLKKGVRRAGELFGSYGLIMAGTRQLRNAWTEALALDKAFTNLNKVQDELSRSDYPEYLDMCNRKAKELATSQKGLIEGATEFSKSGYDLSTSQQLTDKSTILSNVGEMTASDSAKAIISGVQAYDDIDGFTDVVDKAGALIDAYNEIGNTASITSAEIAKGVQAVGSVFADANTDVNEFIALLAAGNRQFQDADSLSLGLRTSALRIRGATAELEAMGEETDGVITSTSKLAEKIQALTNVNGSGGVHILEDDEKTFRSIYDIYVDIGKVYKQMSDVDQSALLDLIAGKHRASGVSATLNNMTEAQEIYKNSLNSSGSAQKEYETYLESSEAALNRFKASMTETYQSVIDGEAVKGLLNCGRASLDFANNLGLVERSLKGIVAIGAVKAITMLSAAFHNSALRANNFGIALNTIRDMSLMTKGTVAYTNALNVLKNVSLNLSETQLKQVLASKALNDVDRIAILRTTGLTKVQAQAKLAQMGLTRSTNAQAVANAAATTSTFSLTAALTGFGMTLKAIFLSNPVGISIMALSMIIGVVSSKMKENAEKANESKQAFNELTSEISSINEEFKTTSDRLKELNAIGYDNLSLVEKEEYDRLVSTNDELERELRIKQALADVAGKEAATDASNALGKKSENSISQVNTYGSGSQTAVKVDRLDYLGENIDFAEQQGEALDRAKQALYEYETAFTGTNEELVNDSTWKRMNSNVDEITDTITNTEKVISDTYAGVETDSEGLVDSTGKVIAGYEDMYNRVQSIKDRLDGYFNPELEVTNLDSLNKLFGKDKVASLSDKQLEVAYSIRNIGDLTWDEFKEKLKEVDELKKEAEKPITIQMAISDIESLSDGLEKINSILDDVKDKGTFDFGSLIDEGFVATFGDYKTEYQNFVNTIANSPNDIKACQQAFDDLTTAYIYGNDALKNVTNETYDATVAMLKQKGVANASEVATMALAKSKINAFIAGRDLKDMTDAEITAFLHENGVIEVTNSMLDALRLAKLTVNGTALDFAGDIEGITSLVEKIGGSIVALKMLGEAKKAQELGANSYAWSGMSDVANAAKGEVQAALNQAMSVKVDYQGYTPPKSSSSGSKSSSTKEDYKADIDKYKELTDAVNAVQENIDRLNLAYDNTTDIEQQIKVKEQLITEYEQEKKAIDALNKARDIEIAQNAKKLSQAGFQVEYDTIGDNLQIKNREHLNDLSQDTIKDYEDLIKKTDELNDANKDSAKQWNELTYTISDTVDEISKLKSDQYEDYISDAEHLIELLDKRSDTAGQSIAVIQRMMDAAVSDWERLVQEGYEKNKDKIHQLESDWMSYYDEILKRQKEVLEAEKESKDSTINAVISVLDDQIKGIDDQIEALQKLNDERKEALDLQKAQDAYDKAKSQRTKSVLRKGQGYVYEADEDAISEAQENLADIQYNNRISALEKEKEAIEEYKELWSSIPDEYEKSQNELIAEQELGAHWENKITDLRLSTYRSFKDDYFDLQDDIESKTEELNQHLNEEYINMVKIFEQMSNLMGQTPVNNTSIESMMSDEDKAAIKTAQSAYNTAKAQGNQTAMDSAHAIAESIRDKYRTDEVDTPNTTSTGTPITNASNTTSYTKQPYELVSSTKTGGSSSGGNSSLRSEYERQLSLAEKYGGSEAYKDRLKTNIAIEKYGSGHNIDTYNNGTTTSTIVNATNKSELNMSANDIQKKYEASVKNNTNSLDKVDTGLKGNTDATEYAGDAMYDASDSISESVKTMAETNKETSNSFISALSSLSGSFSSGSSSSGGSSKSSSKSSSSDGGSSSSSAFSAVKKLASSAVSAAKKLFSSKKKATGGINLPADIYNTDEQGDELKIEPQQGNWVSVSSGTSILPADISKNLMNFGSDPTAYLRQMSANQIAGVTRIQNNTTPIVNNYQFGTIEANLSGVKDVMGFMEELDRLPQLLNQYDSRS